MEWYHVLTIILGNVAIFLPMLFWIRSEGNSDRRDITKILFELKEESKDFHTKLALQDQEYKFHMMQHHK